MKVKQKQKQLNNLLRCNVVERRNVIRTVFLIIDLKARDET